MVEEPNFDYTYDLALWKSFSSRLSVTILLVAAGVFLAAMLTYLYYSEETVKEETAAKAKNQLHDAVIKVRMQECEAKMKGDTLSTDSIVSIIKQVKPYPHSFTLVATQEGKFLYVGNRIVMEQTGPELRKMIASMVSGKQGMCQIFGQSKPSLLLYEPVECNGLHAAVVCSRMDILSSYKSLIFYGAVAFLLGLLILFVLCTTVIYRLVRPLRLFAESAMGIANGNLDTPLPDIKSEDELKQLHRAFEYMQTSLKQYIEDLKVTTATKEHMQSELTIAHNIQMGMIPTSFPKHPEFGIFASMEPAKQVGGDLYDFLVDNNELFFIVGDVAGKGVPASLYMAVTRTLFRNLAGNYQSAANVVREINHAIASTNESCVFVTLFVGVLDLKTHLLTFCNASHNPPILIPEDGPCSYLDVIPQVPVGIVDRFSYEEQQINLAPGASLLLYTDGLTERVNNANELFGEDRLLAEASMCKGVDAEQSVTFIKRRVDSFAEGAEQNDDITMLFLNHKKHEQAVEDRRTLLLKNEMAEVERLRGFVLSFCREHHQPNGFAMSVNLAVEEAVVNVINYAYPKGIRGNVHLTAVMEPGKLVMQIKDYGIPFDPTKADNANINASLEERRIGGLGIHLVKTIMDEMIYERTADGANVLTLSKKIEPKST